MSAGSLVQSHTQIPSPSTEQIRRSVLQLRNSNRHSGITSPSRSLQGLASEFAGLTIRGSENHDGGVPQIRKSSRMQLLSGLRTAPRRDTTADHSLTTGLIHGEPPGPNSLGQQTSFTPSARHVPKPLIFLNSPSDGDVGVTSSRRGSKHSRAASSSAMHLPKSPSPLSAYYIAETPETLPEYDPDLYALLQQQHQELLATNIFLAQQQQQRLQEQIRLQQLALNGARSPIYQTEYSIPSGGVLNSALYPQYMQTSPPYDAGKFNLKSPTVSGMPYQNGSSSYNPSQPVTAVPAVSRPVSAGLTPPSPAISPAFNSSANNNNAGKSWRTRGHRKTASSITFNGAGSVREGSPIRQPIGPPPMDELVAADSATGGVKPNFASRLRRKAVHQLVQAGVERRKGGEGRNLSSNQYGHNLINHLQAPHVMEDDKSSKRRSALF